MLRWLLSCEGHAAACASSTTHVQRAKSVHLVEHRAVSQIAELKSLQLLGVAVSVIWCDTLQEIDVVFCMEFTHLIKLCNVGQIHFHLSVQSVRQHERVRECKAVRFHRMA